MQQNRIALGAVLVGVGVIALIVVFTTRFETWLEFIVAFAGGAMLVRGLIMLFTAGKEGPSQEWNMKCFYIKHGAGTAKLERGTLQILRDRIDFTDFATGRGFQVPYSNLIKSAVLPVNSVPEKIPGPPRVSTKPYALLEVIHNATQEGNESSVRFWAEQDRLGYFQQKMESAKYQYSEETAEYMKCPYCAEMIKAEAILCRHCGSDLRKPPS